MKRNKRKTHTAKGMRFYYLTVLLLSLCLALYAVSAVNDIYAFVKADVSATVTVGEEASAGQVGAELRRMGLIRHSGLFGLLASDASFTPGEYVLSSQMDYEDMVDTLTREAEE